MPSERTMAEIVDDLTVRSLARAGTSLSPADDETRASFERLVARGLVRRRVRFLPRPHMTFYRLTPEGRAACSEGDKDEA